jgi:hypothetical protein
VTPIPIPAFAETLIVPDVVGIGVRSRAGAAVVDGVAVGSGIVSGIAEPDAAGMVMVRDLVLVIVLKGWVIVIALEIGDAELGMAMDVIGVGSGPRMASGRE